MTTTLTAERADLILRLQNARGRARDLYLSEAADHAITLVLEAEHRVGPHAYRNVLRNARSIVAVRRRRIAERRGPPLHGPGVEAGLALSEEITRAADGPADPEQMLIASDLERAIEAAAVGEGGRCAVVLRAMLMGEDVAETAVKLGISDRQVKNIRARVRRLAASLVRPDAMPVPPTRNRCA